MSVKTIKVRCQQVQRWPCQQLFVAVTTRVGSAMDKNAEAKLVGWPRTSIDIIYHGSGGGGNRGEGRAGGYDDRDKRVGGCVGGCGNRDGHGGGD